MWHKPLSNYQYIFLEQSLYRAHYGPKVYSNVGGRQNYFTLQLGVNTDSPSAPLG